MPKKIVILLALSLLLVIPLAYAAFHPLETPEGALCGNNHFSPCIFPLERIGDVVRVSWVSQPAGMEPDGGYQVWSAVGEPVLLTNPTFLNHGTFLSTSTIIPYRDGICATVQSVWISEYYRSNSPDVCLEATPEPPITCPPGYELINGMCVSIIPPTPNVNVTALEERVSYLEMEIAELEEKLNSIINHYKGLES